MERQIPLGAVVVVYNTCCRDSLTCQGLEKLQDEKIRVLIYDNSTEDYGNSQYCRDRGWVYLGGKGNVGISRAYNECIGYLRSFTDARLVCLFDDDTVVDTDYFRILRDAYRQGVRIYVPLIHSAGRLLSPCVIKPGHRVRLFDDDRQAMEYNGTELTAINSCMALDLSVFDRYSYDENIFLDGVDHKFLTDMRAQGEKIRVIPYCCDHTFSGDELPPKEAALVRFGIYAKDYRYVLRDDKIAYNYLVGKRMLRLTMQYRSLDFLKKMYKIRKESTVK